MAPHYPRRRRARRRLAEAGAIRLRLWWLAVPDTLSITPALIGAFPFAGLRRPISLLRLPSLPPPRRPALCAAIALARLPRMKGLFASLEQTTTGPCRRLRRRAACALRRRVQLSEAQSTSCSNSNGVAATVSGSSSPRSIPQHLGRYFRVPAGSTGYQRFINQDMRVSNPCAVGAH
jgi:hypothetical protein